MTEFRVLTFFERPSARNPAAAVDPEHDGCTVHRRERIDVPGCAYSSPAPPR